MLKTRKNIITQFLLAALLTIISAASIFGEAFEGNSHSVWSYRFSGADSSLNATKDCAFWSEDRQAYVTIGELLPGEKVKTRQGTAEFLSKTKIPGSQKVYNLEVYREHNYFVTEEGLLAHNCGETYSGIGSTGVVGQSQVNEIVGGVPNAFKPTPHGARFIDNLLGKSAHEAKTGYASATSFIKKQIAKDVYLLQEEIIKECTWHFFRSPVTGKIGPSKPLGLLLREAGIKVLIHR